MNEKLAIQFYRLLIRFYPRDHRYTFEEEMVGVFKQSLAEARHTGSSAVVVLLLRELLYLLPGLAQAHAQSWREWRPALVGVPGWPWAIGWAAGTTAAFPLAWFMMVPFAAGLLFLLELVGAGNRIDPNLLRALGFLLALALMVATLQWLLLRRHLTVAGWWFGATVASWLAAGTLLAVASVLAARMNAGPLPGIWMIAPVALGLFLGVSQMLILRRLTPHAAWWIPLNLVIFAPILLARGAFGRIPELVFALALPGSLTAAGLWWLLREAAKQGGARETPEVTAKASWFRRPGVLAILAVALLALCFLAPWAYAIGQLELAKSEGIYASVQEAVMARNSTGWGGARVVSIEDVHAGPNRRDGLDHVWFGGAEVTLDRIPQGGRHMEYSTGSFYIRVRDGWVHMPEGAFPELVGWLMEVYDLEGQ